MRLYHYTCSHGAARLGPIAVLHPNPQPMFNGRALLWATDMDTPDAERLGLTSRSLKCDRTEHRYVVNGPFIPWLASPLRLTLSTDQLEAFEASPLDPERWWVSQSDAVAAKV